MADLGEYLAESGALPWEWGTVDAFTAVADWIIANGHGDIMGLHRGAYADEAGYLGIVVKRGGLLPVVADGCARVGIPVADELAPGAIAIMGSLTKPSLQVAAIWDGGFWLMRGPEGFEPVAAPLLGIWSV